MARKKDFNVDTEDEEVVAPHKKHKKHKKKHKKKKQEYQEDEEVLEESVVENVVEIETEQQDYVEEIEVPSTSATSTPGKVPPIKSPDKKNQKKKKVKGKDSGTSSEEERWLDAIESGKLEEVDDELKKIKPKDPKLMTARQRAMYERNTDKEASPGGEVLLSLPTGYKEKVMTAEAIQKAQIKSQKRKQMADEKREKDKKKTMERLLKKQDSKSVKAIKNRPFKAQVPVITYINNLNATTISLPANVPFPLEPQTYKDPPKPRLCGMPGCTNLKKYSCSKTGIALCSYKCYKQNVESVKQIIC